MSPECTRGSGRIAAAVASSCLTRLETLAEGQGVSHELVALIAHFQAAGRSAWRSASRAAARLTPEDIERAESGVLRRCRVRDGRSHPSTEPDAAAAYDAEPRSRFERTERNRPLALALKCVERRMMPPRHSERSKHAQSCISYCCSRGCPHHWPLRVIP